MAVDKKIKYEDQPVIQGGVQNYLGKQPQVMAPRKWQSSPDKPATELAYITKAEKDLILKANIHGGLERGPNMGPSGIMSLDSFGDADAGVSGGLGGGDVSDAETGRSFAGADTISKNYGRDLRAGAVAAGGRERLNEPQSVLNQVRALQKQFGPRVGTNRFGFLNPSNIFSGIMGLINPALGLATRGFNFLGDKLQGLRGYNPDGTPRTQEEYEDYMSQKSLQNRFDKLMDRKLTGKNYSQTNLESLMNMGLTSSKNSLASALARDLQINPEMPQFATSYLGSLNKGIMNPDVRPTQMFNFDPTQFNTRNRDLGELVAELTQKQKDFINKQKFGLQEGLKSPQDVFNTITNPNLGIYDTGTFGFGAQEPTTEEEYNDYLRSIGLTQTI